MCSVRERRHRSHGKSEPDCDLRVGELVDVLESNDRRLVAGKAVDRASYVPHLSHRLGRDAPGRPTTLAPIDVGDDLRSDRREASVVVSVQSIA